MINIRTATMDDSNDIFTWRNDDHTRAMSITTDPVERTDHDQWYENSLTNANRALFIGEKNNQKIGMCRFDLDGDLAIASINLNPDARGKGLSVIFLQNALNEYTKKNPIHLQAVIRKDNIASIRCFEKCGFVLSHSDNDYHYYALNYKASQNELTFTLINRNSTDQVQGLYNLLKNRQHAISHNQLPPIEKHAEFVKKHPYRAWYLVENNNQMIGSFYLAHDNAIGLSDIQKPQKHLAEIMAYIQENYKALPPLPSVRRGEFIINVAPSNTDLKQALTGLSATIVQETYVM